MGEEGWGVWTLPAGIDVWELLAQDPQFLPLLCTAKSHCMVLFIISEERWEKERGERKRGERERVGRKRERREREWECERERKGGEGKGESENERIQITIVRVTKRSDKCAAFGRAAADGRWADCVGCRLAKTLCILECRHKKENNARPLPYLGRPWRSGCVILGLLDRTGVMYWKRGHWTRYYCVVER